MSEAVYIETSILGYLTARSTKNLILAANIDITNDWWESRRNAFMLYTSEAVLNEVAQGDAEIAAQRLETLHDFPLLELNQSVQALAAQFLARSSLPPKANVDAIPIAAATVHGMDYLLTWTANILPTLKFRENWQRLVLISATSYRSFAHPTS